MNIEDYRSYCLHKKGVEEDLPFDENTLAFKVAGKIFALTNLNRFEFINLKCDPEKALELREAFEGVKPGYHMSKKHWNSIYLHEDVNDSLLMELIDHSYDLVFSSLPKTKQKLILSS